MTESTQFPEYVPFDMDCDRCEYEPICFVPLKVVNRLTRRWFQFCRQGRKRRVFRQCTIAEAIDRLNRHKAEREEIVGATG